MSDRTERARPATPPREPGDRASHLFALRSSLFTSIGGALLLFLVL